MQRMVPLSLPVRDRPPSRLRSMAMLMAMLMVMTQERVFVCGRKPQRLARRRAMSLAFHRRTTLCNSFFRASRQPHRSS
jgi:hypothetical protein